MTGLFSEPTVGRVIVIWVFISTPAVSNYCRSRTSRLLQYRLWCWLRDDLVVIFAVKIISGSWRLRIIVVQLLLLWLTASIYMIIGSVHLCCWKWFYYVIHWSWIVGVFSRRHEGRWLPGWLLLVMVMVALLPEDGGGSTKFHYWFSFVIGSSCFLFWRDWDIFVLLGFFLLCHDVLVPASSRLFFHLEILRKLDPLQDRLLVYPE